MKYAVAFIVIILEFLVVKTLKLLDNFGVIFSVFIVVLMIGVFINIYAKKQSSTLKEIVWGMVCGSIIIVLGLIVVIFII